MSKLKKSGFIGSLLESRANESLSGEQILVVQKKKLDLLLRHAAKSVPFYRGFYGGFDPAEATLADIPTVDKRHLMSSPEDYFGDPALRLTAIDKFVASGHASNQLFLGKYIISSTSGTSGHIGYFVNDRSSFDTQKGVLIARNMRSQLRLWQALASPLTGRFRMAMVTPTGGAYISTQTTVFQSAIASLFAISERYSIYTPMGELVSKLNAYQPHYLYGYPTLIDQLCDESAAGNLKISPITIAVSSEPFAVKTQKKIVDAFPKSQISETYSASECLAIASRCDHGHLHINSDFVIVEAVDEFGLPVGNDILSDSILITNLVNTIHPIIRYRLNDRAKINSQKCTCGSNFPVIELHGRTDDTFYLIDSLGRVHAFPPIPLEIICLETRKLLSYQICHREQNVIQVNFVSEAGHEAVVMDDLRGRLSQHFENLLGTGQMNLDLIPVKELVRPAFSNKIRQIYSCVSRPAANR